MKIAGQFLLYENVIMNVFHSVSVGNLGCFHLETIMKNAAINILLNDIWCFISTADIPGHKMIESWR